MNSQGKDQTTANGGASLYPASAKFLCHLCNNIEDFEDTIRCSVCGVDSKDGHCSMCHRDSSCYRCGELCFGKCSPVYEGKIDSTFLEIITIFNEDIYGLNNNKVSDYGFSWDKVSFTYSAMLSDSIGDSEYGTLDPWSKIYCVAKYVRSEHTDLIPLLLRRINRQIDRVKLRNLVPQSSNPVDIVSNIFSTLYEMLKDMSTGAYVWMADVVEILGEFVTNPLGVITDGLVDVMCRSISAKVQHVISDSSDTIKRCAQLFAAHLKMIIRSLMGYPLHHMLFEYISDPVVLKEIPSITSMLTMMLKWVQPQSSSSAVGVCVISALLLMFANLAGTPTSDLNRFNTIHTLAQKLVPSGIDDLVESIPVLGNLFKMDITAIIRDEYPGTYTYMEYRRSLSHRQPLAWEKRQISAAWQLHLEERRMMPETIRRFLLRNPDLFSRYDWIGSTLPEERIQPGCIYFYGASGHGKNTISENISKMIFTYLKSINPGLPRDMEWKDFDFPIPKGVDHMTGLAGQMVYRINDFLAEKEVPGASIANLFLQIVDSAPCMANMAHLNEKGQYHNPLMVLVTSNISWTLFPGILTASNHPAAYVRRCDLYYEVKAKKHDGRTLVEDFDLLSDQYVLVKYDSPKDKIGKECNIYDLYEDALNLTKKKWEQFLKPEKYPLKEDAKAFVEDFINNGHGRQRRYDHSSGIGPPVPLGGILPGLGLVGQGTKLSIPGVATFLFSLFPETEKEVNVIRFHDLFVKSNYRSSVKPLSREDPHMYFAAYAGDCKSADMLKHYYGDSFLFEGMELVEPEDVDYYFFSPVPWIRNYLASKPLLKINSKTVMIGCATAILIKLALLGMTKINKTIKSWRKLDGCEDEYVKEEEDKKPLEINGVKYVPTSIMCGNQYLIVYTKEEDKVKFINPQSHPISYIQREQDKLKDPQGFVQSMFPKDQRLLQEIPGIMKSIVTIGTDFDTKLSKAFAINNQVYLAAAHVIKKIRSKMIVFYEDKAKVFENTEGFTKFTTYVDDNKDLGLIYTPYWRKTHVKSNINKFIVSEENLNYSLVTRLDGSTVSEVAMAHAPKERYYEGKSRSLIRVSLPGIAGMCGLPYMLQGTSSPQKLLGIHVAGNVDDDGDSYIMVVSQTWINSALKKDELKYLSNIQGPKIEEEPPLKGHMFKDYNFEIDGKSERDLFVQRRTVYEVVDDLYKDVNEHWKVTYGLAPLLPRVRDGVREFPEDTRFQAWSTAVTRRGKPFPKEVSDIMGGFFKEKLSPFKVGKFTYDESIKSNAGLDWVSLNRSKAAGSMHPGLPKRIVCCLDEEEPTLTPFAYEVVCILESMHANLQAPTVPSALSLKDEKLPLEKVAKFKPRLFSSVSVWQYILAKKNFAPLLVALSRGGPQVGIMAALNPKGLGEKFSILKERAGMPTDVESCDLSHDMDKWILFLDVLMKSELIEDDEDKVIVDPNLPPLGWQYRVLYSLIREMSMGCFQMRDVLLYINGALGSGSLLTFLLNVFVLFAMHVVFYLNLKNLSVIYYRNYEHFFKENEPRLFGDDAVWTFHSRFLKFLESQNISPGVELKRLALEHGYNLTGPGKSSDLKILPTHQVDFCGRYLFDHPRLGCVMQLEVARIVKAVQFVKKGEFINNFPDQVYGFLLEAGLHSKDVFDKLLEGLVWTNDNSLHKYFERYKLECQRRPSDKQSFYDSVVDLLKNSYVEEVSLNLQPKDLLHIIKLWVYSKDDLVVLSTYEPENENLVGQGEVERPDADVENAQSESKDNAVMDITGPTTDGNMAILDADAHAEESHLPPMDMEASHSFLHDMREDIWSRPRKVADFPWTTTDVAGVDLIALPFPSTYFNDNANAQFKLANTHGIRATIRLRIILNSTPLQQGILAIYASPMARIPSNEFEVLSGPHAILSAGRHNAADIMIPYQRDLLYSQTDAYGIASDELRLFDFVRFGVKVVSPLMALNMVSATVVIFAWLEDIEVMQGGLTNFVLSPQMDKGVDNTKSKNRKKDKKGNAMNKYNPNRVAPAKDEVPSHQGVNPTMDKISAGFKTVADIAVTVAQITSTVISMAALMGLSKPTFRNNMMPVVQRFGAYMPNYDACDYGQTLAISHEQKAVALPGLVGNNDPMDINSLSSRVGLVDIVPYTANTASDFILSALPAVPTIQNGSNPTPLSFLASHFRYWRGTISFRYRLVKTAFQSGTLEVLVDYNSRSISPLSSARANVLHRVVWDIALQEELVVHVPYVSPTHYRPVLPLGELDSFRPVVYLKTLTPLVVNTTVPSEIEIMIETWSNDIQFAWPCLINNIIDPEASKKKTKGKEPMIAGQVMKFASSTTGEGPFDPSNEHALQQEVVLGPRVTSGDPIEMTTRHMGGETILNTRVVTRRFHDVGGSTSVPNIDFANIDAWPLWVRSLSRLFVFGYGGFRVKVQPISDWSALIDGLTTNTIQVGEPRAIQSSTTVPVTELTVPNVSNYPAYVIRQAFNANDRMTPMTAVVSYQEPAGMSPSYSIYAAAHDDFSMFGINYLPQYTLSAPPVHVDPAFVQL